ncbi:response regulator [Candidatus Saccharibacteria bacterium]|nr:response regulator [Candidatus Saccharibacteria bacterium]
MIFIIDDDHEMAECIARAVRPNEARIFKDTIAAISALDEGELPSLIFLDILLDGPDGFTFLNELSSYSDTAKIPVVIISSLNLAQKSLENYGVVGVLDKAMMTPKDIQKFVKRELS